MWRDARRKCFDFGRGEEIEREPLKERNTLFFGSFRKGCFCFFVLPFASSSKKKNGEEQKNSWEVFRPPNRFFGTKKHSSPPCLSLYGRKTGRGRSFFGEREKKEKKGEKTGERPLLPRPKAKVFFTPISSCPKAIWGKEIFVGERNLCQGKKSSWGKEIFVGERNRRFLSPRFDAFWRGVLKVFLFRERYSERDIWSELERENAKKERPSIFFTIYLHLWYSKRRAMLLFFRKVSPYIYFSSSFFERSRFFRKRDTWKNEKREFFERPFFLAPPFTSSFGRAKKKKLRKRDIWK